jgi:predicted dehydrogenase
MAKIKIGFVGVGSMGQCAHLRNYVPLPDVEVVAIAELRPELAKRVAARYNIPHVYRNHEEMFANEKLDAIVAPQPFTVHGQIVPELLKVGIPLLTEKPVAANVPAGELIVEAVKKSGTFYMVANHKRSDPATMYAKAEIERLQASGEAGKLKYVRITMPPGDWIAAGFTDLIRTDEPYPQLAQDPRPVDLDKENYDKYISFVNYYIHQVNLMRYLLGEPYTVSYVDPNDVLMAVTTESGKTGIIEMAPYETTAWHEQALVCFEHATIKIDLPAPLTMFRPGTVEIMMDPGNGKTPVTCRPTLPWIGAMQQQAMNYVAAIKGERRPPCEAAEALEDLRVARQYLRLLRGV